MKTDIKIESQTLKNFHINFQTITFFSRKIEHQYLICDDGDKLQVLFQFLRSQKENRGVIFCKTKAATKCDLYGLGNLPLKK